MPRGSWAPGAEPSLSLPLPLSCPRWASWERPGEAPPGLRAGRGGNLRAASPIAHRHRGAITAPSVVSGSQAGAGNQLLAPSELRGGASGSGWPRRLGSALPSSLPGPAPISPCSVPLPPPGVSWVPARPPLQDALQAWPCRPGEEALPINHLVPSWASRPLFIPPGRTGGWSEGWPGPLSFPACWVLHPQPATGARELGLSHAWTMPARSRGCGQQPGHCQAQGPESGWETQASRKRARCRVRAGGPCLGTPVSHWGGLGAS